MDSFVITYRVILLLQFVYRIGYKNQIIQGGTNFTTLFGHFYLSY